MIDAAKAFVLLARSKMREKHSATDAERDGQQVAQQGAQFDIGNRLNADQFNSQQGLNGANFRLGAAGQLGNMGVAQDANDRANLGLMGDLGAQQQ